MGLRLATDLHWCGMRADMNSPVRDGPLALLLHNLDPRTYLSSSFFAYVTLALAFHYGGLHEPWPASSGSWTSTPTHIVYALRIMLRNAALTWVVYSLWYWALYERHPSISTAKLNKETQGAPPIDQVRFERARVMAGSLVASLAEIMCAVLVRNHAEESFGAFHTCCFAVLGAAWSDYHFYAAHRVLHAWWPHASARIDPGRWLYCHVHSVHHKAVKSVNPWSGLSMHWFEHLLYFSRAPLFVFLCPARVPPAVFLYINIRALIGPAPGHHGFEDCLGSRFHYYHHVYYNVNFGTRPCDGTDILAGTLRQ